MNWYKTAQIYDYDQASNWYKLAAQYIDREILENRLRAIGWNMDEQRDGDYMAFAPDGIVKLTMVSKHNWEKSWIWAKKHLIRQNPDLDFVFDRTFVIPDHFDMLTQKIQEPSQPIPQTKTIPFNQLPNHLIFNFELQTQNGWQSVSDIDYTNKEILLNNNDVIQFDKLTSPVNIRHLSRK